MGEAFPSRHSVGRSSLVLATSARSRVRAGVTYFNRGFVAPVVLRYRSGGARAPTVSVVPKYYSNSGFLPLFTPSRFRGATDPGS